MFVIMNPRIRRGLWIPIISSPHPAVLFPSFQAELGSLVHVDVRAQRCLAPLMASLACVSMPRPTTVVVRFDRPGCPRVVACGMDLRRAQHRLVQYRCGTAMSSTQAVHGYATWV